MKAGFTVSHTSYLPVVGGAIIRDNDGTIEVLCAQRGPGRAMSGYWEFPGGKVEPGETEEEALARELFEELDISVEVRSHVATTPYSYDFGDISLSVYVSTIEEGEPTRSEHQSLGWVPVADLSDLRWAPADIPAMEKLRDTLTS
ncbi:(deoxy)nucleoside triphosphate pyrophosphohydrolase [Corynebacterium pyruviciproducens]|uniref:8-oxo-dGTP diphosphatase n=1 Tax=Corynebacterium pyruviciproducens TaxID=598660 RepID=A0AAF0YPU6_9CORY|nr:(deoxy)nucleoside triphosphate pyrophosphohydrolase [Corynebacterium pyruviciproducens]MDH4657828.1 (deoxy)nucleoside triphosphate pyrophosphohydrolase [Corynebacterium pyruviciproducens]MDK6565713.1 (deoxy)nucleoside triphosphate pyrophosphohydrolase [Corynebacterium pyruviciproducens]MDK7213839.1 (deoxy)nucleoside triphosphate pyrophosphohydrolase [Corynebacterium pyruviciproducens]WOT01202.1 (deoxy)nucleoside triphosphate pyrophosphohydrolase [Corynebacterium pyruviciproducens]